MKKILALLLLLTCTTAALAGCSNNTKPVSSEVNEENQSKNNNESNGNMGRYIEENIPLPDLSENEYIMNFLKNKDNQLEVYSTHYDKDSSEYLCYRLEPDNTWNKTKIKGLNSDLLGPDSSIGVVRMGSDGSYYFLHKSYSDGITKDKILHLKDHDSVLEEVNIPYLNETLKKQGKQDSYPYIIDFFVLENGQIVLCEGYNGETLVFISPDGDVLKEIASDYDQYFRYFPYGNEVLYPNESAAGMNAYNAETGDIKELKELSLSENSTTVTSGKNGTVYVVNSDGIQALSEGGSLWEIVVDGSLNSMNMPTMTPNALFVDESGKDEFIVSYSNSSGNNFLMRYYFNPDVVSVPSKEITVYSLKENRTVMQALPQFHARNSDVKINYIVAMQGDEENVSDYIRALNSELLNGNGADILILDDMPIDSYIEKGILADLSDLIKPLEASGELNSKLLESYYQDDKLYKLPLRYSVPLAVGNKDAIKAMESMSSIVNYIEENHSLAFTNTMTYKELITDYLALYSDEFFENGTLNDTAYKGFLNNLRIIADNIEATEVNQLSRWKENSLFKGNLISVPWKQNVAVTNVVSINDLMIIGTLVRDKGVSYDSINSKYLPSGVIGLNRSSKEIDLAKDFIAHLLSTEVQDAEVYEGFPINNIAMEQWLARQNDNIMVMLDDGEGNVLEGIWPNKKEREQWGELVKTLTSPIEINYTLNEMMMNETLPFFIGSTTADSIAAALKSKVNTYLAE